MIPAKKAANKVFKGFKIEEPPGVRKPIFECFNSRMLNPLYFQPRRPFKHLKLQFETRTFFKDKIINKIISVY